MCDVGSVRGRPSEFYLLLMCRAKISIYYAERVLFITDGPSEFYLLRMYKRASADR